MINYVIIAKKLIVSYRVKKAGQIMIKKFLRDARHFIRIHLIDHSKFLTILNQQRIKRAQEAAYIRHQTMSYSEIESEVGNTYERIFNRKLNWDNPQTYNEKINVSKVYMATPEKTRLADKYLVREWIREKIGDKYLIPLLGVYDSFDEINFDSLPDKFVIKCNHDSGSFTFVRDKRKINIPALKIKYDYLLKRNYAWGDFEMHYRDIKPKILIEEFMGDGIMCDYKFMCFDGKAYYCQVHFNLNAKKGIGHTRNFYDMDWNIINCYCLPTPMDYNERKCPEEYNLMRGLAEKLSEGFDQVRVDLSLVGHKIYFGEMTFTDGAGLAKFVPDEWDYKFGALWPFDNEVRKKILAAHSSPLN